MSSVSSPCLFKKTRVAASIEVWQRGRSLGAKGWCLMRRGIMQGPGQWQHDIMWHCVMWWHFWVLLAAGASHPLFLLWRRLSLAGTSGMLLDGHLQRTNSKCSKPSRRSVTFLWEGVGQNAKFCSSLRFCVMKPPSPPPSEPFAAQRLWSPSREWLWRGRAMLHWSTGSYKT